MTANLTASALTFNAERHEYTLPDGSIVPSVTEVLRATGVSVDFDELGRLHSLARTIEARRELGRAVHADCHAFDDDDLEWASVDYRVLPYVNAWAACRENTGLVPLERERVVYDPRLRYCGTFDGIFERRGRIILVDLKIGNPEEAGAQFQTAAYAAAYRTEHPEVTIDERWSVELTPEHGIPYRIHTYGGWDDFLRFAAFVTTYYAQARRRATR